MSVDHITGSDSSDGSESSDGDDNRSSSGGSDSGSSDDDRNIEKKGKVVYRSSDDDDDNSSQDSSTSNSSVNDDVDDSTGQRGAGRTKRRGSRNNDDHNDNDEGEDVLVEEDTGPDYTTLPLSDRIQRQQEQGISSILSARRDRRSKAIQVASKRLSQLRDNRRDNTKADSGRSKRSPHQQQRAEHDDYDDGSNDNSENEDDGYPQAASSSAAAKERKKKKKSKHAPTEMSSKRADFYASKKNDTYQPRRAGGGALHASGLGVDAHAHRYKPRDPRMSSLSGHYDANQMDHKYAFLQQLRDQEIAQLKKRIKARKTTGRKGQHERRKLGLTTPATAGTLDADQAELKRLIQEKADHARDQLDRSAKHAVKKKLQQGVAEGRHAAYFPKRAEMKQLVNQEKMNVIRRTRGGDAAVEKIQVKKRKKNKSRDAGLLGSVDLGGGGVGGASRRSR